MEPPRCQMDLPDDVLRHLFGFLSPKCLLAARLVCLDWARIDGSKWTVVVELLKERKRRQRRARLKGGAIACGGVTVGVAYFGLLSSCVVLAPVSTWAVLNLPATMSPFAWATELVQQGYSTIDSELERAKHETVDSLWATEAEPERTYVIIDDSEYENKMRPSKVSELLRLDESRARPAEQQGAAAPSQARSLQPGGRFCYLFGFGCIRKR
eukprot:TRINITY_DN100112_c0_g1_i1.p1 TRINITY_DN100112_c0_g1~~TRINITY_DN100112_c0_g1_i1.p1  ORF type:complete len:212 (+),score=20.59 TRINITY_DN100112_c0_g1_i1:43-678(+)